MKRVGNLIEAIADLDNLYLAFWKAQRGKDAKKGVLDFRKDLHQNLLSLQTQISRKSLKLLKNLTFQKKLVAIYLPKF